MDGGKNRCLSLSRVRDGGGEVYSAFPEYGPEAGGTIPPIRSRWRSWRWIRASGRSTRWRTGNGGSRISPGRRGPWRSGRSCRGDFATSSGRSIGRSWSGLRRRWIGGGRSCLQSASDGSIVRLGSRRRLTAGCNGISTSFPRGSGGTRWKKNRRKIYAVERLFRISRPG